MTGASAAVNVDSTVVMSGEHRKLTSECQNLNPHVCFCASPASYHDCFIPSLPINPSYKF